MRYPAAGGRRQGSEWTTAATHPSQDGRQHEQATVLLHQSGWGPGETCKRAGSAWLYPQIRPLCYQRHASQRDGKVLCRRGGISWARPPPSNDPIIDWTRLWLKLRILFSSTSISKKMTRMHTFSYLVALSAGRRKWLPLSWKLVKHLLILPSFLYLTF